MLNGPLQPTEEISDGLLWYLSSLELYELSRRSHSYLKSLDLQSHVSFQEWYRGFKGCISNKNQHLSDSNVTQINSEVSLKRNSLD